MKVVGIASEWIIYVTTIALLILFRAKRGYVLVELNLLVVVVLVTDHSESEVYVEAKYLAYFCAKTLQ